MTPTFDVNRFKTLKASTPVRYQKRLAELHGQGMTTGCIEAAVESAITNLKKHQAKSFVIYGEPQSGKQK